MRCITTNEYKRLLLISAALVISFITSMIMTMARGSLRTLSTDLTEGLLLFFTVAAFLLMVLVIVERIIPYRNERAEIESKLLQMGVFSETSIKGVVQVPEMVVSDESIILKLDNPSFRFKLEAHIDALSSILPAAWVVNRVSMNRSQNELRIEYIDTSKQSRLVYHSINDFQKDIRRLPDTVFRLDQRHVIDLNRTPHVLIAGTTGSGKSYYAQQLICQALMKKHEVVILDFKRSYQAFRKCCRVAFSTNEIADELQHVIIELHERQRAMDSILETNPKAQAHIEGGFKLKMVVFEEYLALVNSNIDKKELAAIERNLIEICTTGRSLGIVLVMIMQQSDATSLPTKIRSNLPARLAFGDCSRSIYETAFGIGNAPKTAVSFKKGEGYAMLDSTMPFTFAAPTLQFEIIELLAQIEKN